MIYPNKLRSFHISLKTGDMFQLIVLHTMYESAYEYMIIHYFLA